MAFATLCVVAFAASALTFFSGFGLGTLLLPAFAWFYPVEVAVASTAVVHFLNGLFKLGIAGRSADRTIALRFGIPAVLAAFVGARLLVALAGAAPLATYHVGAVRATIAPVKLVIGVLLVLVAAAELTPRLSTLAVPPRFIPLGGILSGFFGGLSGVQGAFRSAFLVRAGLSKEAFIGTGVVIAVLIDVSRLSVYGGALRNEWVRVDRPMIVAAVLSAFAGAFLGSRLLRKVTMRALRSLVGVAVALAGLALAAGLL